jgi:DNA-binding XRE family transcriptional regulator
MSNIQVIFDQGKPMFVVIKYDEFLALTGRRASKQVSKQAADEEFMPFVLSNYIQNPLKVKRIESGLTQKDLAKAMGVSQGYISRIEAPGYSVTKQVEGRVSEAIATYNSKTGKRRRS